MKNDEQDFEQFMKRREEAARAYVNGDANPLGSITTRVSPATFFSPKGDYQQGSAQVYATYESDATHFTSGDTHFEILHMGANAGIGYWVGFQRAIVQFDGNSKTIPFNLRVTEVFRREGDEWKLIHRHADVLASESEENKK